MVIWIVYSVLQICVIVKVLRERPLLPTTPRFIYRWFQRLYQLSYILGVSGYVLIIADFFGFANFLPKINDPELTRLHLRNPWFFETGLLLLFYGTYFGLLSRDLIQVLSERMAFQIGYYTPDGLPIKHLRDGICALCNDSTNSLIPVVQLSCSHKFHLPCLKGWLLIGKKQTCPYCAEKVDISKVPTNPWDTQQSFYLLILDYIRWIMIWQPVVLLLVKTIYWTFNLD